MLQSRRRVIGTSWTSTRQTKRLLTSPLELRGKMGRSRESASGPKCLLTSSGQPRSGAGGGGGGGAGGAGQPSVANITEPSVHVCVAGGGGGGAGGGGRAATGLDG